MILLLLSALIFNSYGQGNLTEGNYGRYTLRNIRCNGIAANLDGFRFNLMKPDPYFIAYGYMEDGSKKLIHTGKVKEEEVDPVWSETVKFPYDNYESIVVEFWDKDDSLLEGWEDDYIMDMDIGMIGGCDGEIVTDKLVSNHDSSDDAGHAVECSMDVYETCLNQCEVDAKKDCR